MLVSWGSLLSHWFYGSPSVLCCVDDHLLRRRSFTESRVFSLFDGSLLRLTVDLCCVMESCLVFVSLLVGVLGRLLVVVLGRLLVGALGRLLVGVLGPLLVAS